MKFRTVGEAGERSSAIRHWAVRHYLIALVAAALLPGIIGAGGLFYQEYLEGKGRLARDTIFTARALTQAVDAYLLQAQAIALALSTDDSLAKRDFRQFHKRASEVLLRTGIGNNVVLADAAGQQVVNIRKAYGEPLPRHSAPDVIRQVFATGRPVISDMRNGVVLRGPLINVDVPVFIDGKVAYVLSFAILPSQFGTIIEHQGLPKSWITAVFDSSGTIVARSHAADQFVGQKGTGEFIRRIHETREGAIETVTREGIPTFSVYSKSPTTNWSIGIGIPRQELAADLQRTLWRLAIGVVALLGVCCALALAAGRRIALSVQRLKLLAMELGQGKPALKPFYRIQEVEDIAQAMLDADGERRKAEEALRNKEQILRLALKAGRSGTFHWDVQTDENRWSDELLDLYGLRRGEFGGRSGDWLACLVPEDREGGAAAIYQSLSTGNFSLDFRIRRRNDGEIRWMAGRAQVLFDAERKPVRMLGINIDITDLKQAEREIHRLNTELEERVRERTAELAAANRELEGFTFAASHDLKGPLSRLESFSRLLESRYRDRLEGDGLLFIDFIRQNALRLNQLVDDLLSHARVAQQELGLQPIDVRETVNAIVREQAEGIRKHGAQVHLEVPPVAVLADPHLLQQVLVNLLENALKYSAHSSPPVIEIGGDSTNGRCRLWVRDNGIGFDMKYRERIFEIFRRLHAYNEIPGNGVGLALVRRAMERMGGNVWAESEPGQGAAFFLELHLAEAGDLAEEPARESLQ